MKFLYWNYCVIQSITVPSAMLIFLTGIYEAHCLLNPKIMKHELACMPEGTHKNTGAEWQECWQSFPQGSFARLSPLREDGETLVE